MQIPHHKDVSSPSDAFRAGPGWGLGPRPEAKQKGLPQGFLTSLEMPLEQPGSLRQESGAGLACESFAASWVTWRVRPQFPNLLCKIGVIVSVMRGGYSISCEISDTMLAACLALAWLRDTAPYSSDRSYD